MGGTWLYTLIRSLPFVFFLFLFSLETDSTASRLVVSVYQMLQTGRDPLLSVGEGWWLKPYGLICWFRNLLVIDHARISFSLFERGIEEENKISLIFLGNIQFRLF